MSSIVCVDASFIVGLVSDRLPACSPLWTAWQNANLQIAAPTLIYYEITNAFHRLSLANQIPSVQADQFIQAAINLETYLLPTMLTISLLQND